MTSSQPQFRKTRFVCISDTHNCTVRLPKGDVLIHAGDLTNQGSYAELSRAVEWLEKADFEAKIVIAGNHDITLDQKFYHEFGQLFHSQQPQSLAECQALLSSSKSITYLKHEPVAIRLTSPTGPQTAFTVFGSPYSPSRGTWAFGYDAPTDGIPLSVSDLPRLWEDIPLDTDVVLTHTPPYSHCDETKERRAGGCEALRRALWRVRPKLAVCGHIHEARGVERVRWDLNGGNVAFKEVGVEKWEDPAPTGNKISLVDLTRKGGKPLDNDNGVGAEETREGRPHDHEQGGVPEGGLDGAGCSHAAGAEGSSGRSAAETGESAEPGIGTIGLGRGASESVRSDLAAVAGRLDRRETCVINCAIMAKSYPHVGGRVLNKPIVVDIELPVWEMPPAVVRIGEHSGPSS